VKDITSLCKKAAKRKLIPVVRLNGTSDLPWERIKGSSGLTLMQTFPTVQFYDYTKHPGRIWDCHYGSTLPHGNPWPPNYHLTYSRSEDNADVAQSFPFGGVNVAVVFGVKRGQPLPKEWGGYSVIDGDINDLRFLDPKGVVVGLRAKGKARKDASGFVVRNV
jgi:hypothetical protein